jgi:hypothetical protein
MAPYVFRTTDYGKTWTPLVTPQDVKGVRGYAHVIKEDLVKPDLLFLGTEFGSGSQSTAGKTGRSSRPTIFPLLLFGIWQFIRVTMISFWQRTVVAFGLSMTSHRYVLSRRSFDAGCRLCFSASRAAAN